VPPSATDESRIAPTRLRAVLVVAALFTFFFAAYAFTMSADLYNNGDTAIRVAVAENLAEGRVYLDGQKMQFPPHVKKEYYDARIWYCHGSLVCSTYLLGQPLAIIPFDKLGNLIAHQERWPLGPAVLAIDHLVGPLFGALEAVVFFLFAVRLGYGVPRAVALTLILGFATSVWPDEQSVLEHTEVAFFLLLAMYGAYRFREQNRSWLYLVLAGVGLGGAAITRYQDAFLGSVGLAAYLLWPGGRSAGAWFLSRAHWFLLVALGILPFALLDLWWNWARFGSPLATGHHETVFGYAVWLGAPGLLVSPGKGLLWYSPTILLLALAGPPFARRFPALSVGIAALFVSFVLLYADVTYWHGDPAWGPRYIYPTIPFLTLPLGMLLTGRIRLAPLVWMATVLMVLAGFTVQLAGVSVSEWRSWYKVVAYEENQGREWQWIAARYRYFWDPHESPLYFQLHGLYDLAYDNFGHRTKYALVPPDEDPVLDNLASEYAINQWNFWWASTDFNWWMGPDKVFLGAVCLLALMAASGTYVAAESFGVFREPGVAATVEPMPEAA
jgi:hypothetical protein